MDEPHVLAIRKPNGTLGAIPVRDYEKAKEVAKFKTINVAGTKCEVMGLVSEKDFEGMKIFYEQPARDQLKQNVQYLRKYKKWPRV